MPFSHVILTNSALTSSLKVVARARTLASTSSYIIVDNTARPHTTGRIQPGRRLSFRSSSNKNAILQRFYSFDYRTSGGWLAQTDPIHDQDDTEATANMPIMHIVLFEFKPTLHHTQIEDICKRMLALSTDCVHQTTQKPYVTGYGGGRDTSQEGHQGGFSHGFISEFQNEADRKYYLEEDPAHLEFVKSLDGIVENVRVVDFENGKF